MGLSLVEAAPALLARATGTAQTAPLFALVPILSLAGCAWAAARALLRLGAAQSDAVLFGVALVFATPLWGYAASDYGEPLQALCVAVTVLALVELRESPAPRRWQVALGVRGRLCDPDEDAAAPRRRAARSRGGLSARRGSEKDFGEDGRTAGRARARRKAPPGCWQSRCRGPCFFRSQEFSFSGLSSSSSGLASSAAGTRARRSRTRSSRVSSVSRWLPNKGLLWYAPVVALSVPGFLVLRRRDSRLALALTASFLALLSASSAWWAWDGQAGWGPRLLLPALPSLLALGGLVFAAGSRPWRLAGFATVAAGVLVNALGALVPFPAVYVLASQVPPQPITEGRASGTPYEIERGADGVLRATGPHHLSLTPAWSPIRVHALVLAGRMRGSFDGSLPSLDPPFRPAMPPAPAPALRLALAPVRLGWGRDFFPGGLGEGVEADPYRDGLRDQLVRAIDVKDFSRAAEVGGELERAEEKISANDPRTVALLAEALRLDGGRVVRWAGPVAPQAEPGAAAALSYLSKKSLTSPPSRFACTPWILFVRAMAAPTGDFACLPEVQREGFARGVEIARRRGWTLTQWNRAVVTGRP